VKHPAIYQPSRTESENVILMLCKHYPACFFEKNEQRRPLKQNIVTDIIRDADFEAAPELITAAVEWYEGHISYAYATIAGAKRIDLDGNGVGTITIEEALVARQRVNEFNAKRRAVQGPARILEEMRASGQISDCAAKMPEAPPMASNKTKAATTAPEFALLYETLMAANAAVVGIGDPAMRAVVAKTLLDVVIEKFRQARSEMDLENT
jgi:sRNA-binding protein